PESHRSLEDITLHPQLDILPPQPVQLDALALAQRRVAVFPAASLPRAPVTQRALVDAQLPGHLRDRLPRLEHQPHRTRPKVLIELPVLPRHRSSLKRCLHATRGSPRPCPTARGTVARGRPWPP